MMFVRSSGWLCCVVLIVVLVLHSDALKRYDGYKVLRVNTTNEVVKKELFVLCDKLNIDVWAENKIESWTDVMVSEMYHGILSDHFDHLVTVDDVQSLLDENEQERKNNKVVGDFFTDFPPTEEILKWLDEQINLQPDVASKVIIGKTYLGNDITGLQLTRDPSKPVFYIHCTIHAREWIATTTCLWIIDNLLNNPNDNAWLDKFRWIIVPVLNVDGYDYTHTDDRLWRKNRAPNSGSSCVGTDVNRNYGYQWGGAGASSSPCSETYRGSSAFSSPESFSERSFLKPFVDTYSVAAYIDIHSYGGYFMSAWGYTYSYPPPLDYDVMAAQMSASVAAIRAVNGNSYTAGSSSNVLYQTSGSTVDFYYGDGDIVQSYTIECTGNNFTPPTSAIPIVGAEVWAGVKSVATNV